MALIEKIFSFLTIILLFRRWKTFSRPDRIRLVPEREPWSRVWNRSGSIFSGEKITKKWSGIGCQPKLKPQAFKAVKEENIYLRIYTVYECIILLFYLQYYRTYLRKIIIKHLAFQDVYSSPLSVKQRM